MQSLPPHLIATGQVLAVAAIALGNYRTVQRYAAVRTLTPPDDLKVAPAVVPTTPTLPLWRRILSRKTLAATVLSIAIFGTYFLFAFIMGYVIPRYGTQAVVDGFFGAFMWCNTNFILYVSLKGLWPASRSIRYVKHKAADPASPLVLGPGDVQPSWARQHSFTCLLVATTFTSYMFFLAYQGSNVYVPLIVGALSTSLLASFAVRRVTVRHLTYILLGFEFGIPLLIAILVPIIMFFINRSKNSADPSEPEPATEEENLTEPSAWIISFGMIWNYFHPIVLPGIMVGINMRYEFCRDVEEPHRLPAGAAAVIPTSLPKFRMPITIASVAGFAASLLFIDALAYFVPVTREFFRKGMFAYFVTVPFVLVASILAARSRGELRDWWNYSETWIPTVVKNDDIEKTAAAEHVPLLVAAEDTEADTKVDIFA